MPTDLQTIQSWMRFPCDCGVSRERNCIEPCDQNTGFHPGPYEARPASPVFMYISGLSGQGELLRRPPSSCLGGRPRPSIYLSPLVFSRCCQPPACRARWGRRTYCRLAGPSCWGDNCGQWSSEHLHLKHSKLHSKKLALLKCLHRLLSESDTGLR